MICLDLLIGFLKVGLFAFGGAYGAIPLIRDVVLSYGWLDDEMLTYMIAVSESTPGPIMVNLATYVGSSQAGFPGALIATMAVVMPSFIIILLIMVLLKKLLKAFSPRRSITGHGCSLASRRTPPPAVSRGWSLKRRKRLFIPTIILSPVKRSL